MSMVWEIRPEAAEVFRAMAGAYADGSISEVLLPSLSRAVGRGPAGASEIKDALLDPYLCLRAVYAHYAFSRRGKDRADLSELAAEALRRVNAEVGFDRFLAMPDGTRLWREFEACCAERGRRPMDQLNLGVIAGLAELAQEIYRRGESGSIAAWIVDGVRRTDRVEPQFMRMVDIRGVGPKLSSVLVRDVAFLFQLEEGLDHVDRLYVQPIDKYLRALAPFVVDELADVEAPDWILAGKLAKYARRAGVSGIRFNMGTGFFGSRVAPTPAQFEQGVRQIADRARSGVPRT